MAKKPLEPLISLDQLKEFVAAIARVPRSALKDAVRKAEESKPKSRLKTPVKRKKTAKKKP